jgi:hypothetical protein
MAISLTHTTVAVGTDAGNGEIRKAQWNEAHTLTMATARLLGRSTGGAGAVEEISIGSGLTLSGGTLTNAGGMTLLGTISTATGSNPTLSSLTLTGYKQLQLVFQAVSQSATNSIFLGTSTADDIQITTALDAAEFLFGISTIDLTNGAFSSLLYETTASSNTSVDGGPKYGGDLPITTASTQISLALSGAGNFDNGSVLVYGIA